jgi:O-antigen/teichoic acid export membrane protein
MKLANVWSWVKILTSYFSLQLLMQACGAVVSILIVRTLDKQDYAFYTITNAFLGSASNLADCGISAALSAIGGKLWHDRVGFGSLLNTAFGIRKWFTIAVVTIICLSMPVMLFHNGAGFFKITILAVLVIVSILFQFGAGIYGVVPQLRLDYKVLQKVSLYAVIIRVLLLGCAYLILLNSTTAVLINAIALGCQMWIYKRYAERNLAMEAKPDPQMRRTILHIVRKQIPYELYGALSGQISVFLLTFFGSKASVADVGALGRIAMLFTAMSSVFGNILVPRFARCQEKHRLSPLFLKIIGLYFAAVGSVLLLPWFFSRQLVGLLGRQYSNMGSQCFLAVLTAVVGAMFGAVWGLNQSRGWIVPAWVGLSAGVGAQILGIMVFNIRTVHGVLMMSLCTNIAGLLVNLLASVVFLQKAKTHIAAEESLLHG